MAAPRIVLVDDHALCRNGLTDLLTHRGGMEVLAALSDPEQVIAVLRETQPDLVVLDLRMPAIDGLTLLRRIRAEGIDTPALILTMSDSEVDLSAALRAGARGYLLKDMEPEDVIAAIGRAARGELSVAPALTLKLAQMLQAAAAAFQIDEDVATAIGTGMANRVGSTRARRRTRAGAASKRHSPAPTMKAPG